MDDINDQVLNALDVHSTIRILGDLPTDALNPEDYLASVSSTIKDFVAVGQERAETRLLAVEVWPRHTYFALDLNNDQYDYDTAHTEIIALPVLGDAVSGNSTVPASGCLTGKENCGLASRKRPGSTSFLSLKITPKLLCTTRLVIM